MKGACNVLDCLTQANMVDNNKASESWSIRLTSFSSPSISQNLFVVTWALLPIQCVISDLLQEVFCLLISFCLSKCISICSWDSWFPRLLFFYAWFFTFHLFCHMLFLITSSWVTYHLINVTNWHVNIFILCMHALYCLFLTFAFSFKCFYQNWTTFMFLCKFKPNQNVMIFT